MNCPQCDSPTGIVESRIVFEGKRRRRQCPQCKHKFTTYEKLHDEGRRYEKLTRKLDNTLQVLEFMQHNINAAIVKLKELDEEVM
jgi:transcriptional regulator NrdR family protein